MERIHITDVAPRDGLQNQQVQVSTAAKLELIRLLAAAGMQSVEATSFVSPKAVPQMADAGDLVAQLNAALPELRSSVLVPNLKGLERAHAAGAQEIAVVLSATETMNRKNINMGLDEATEVSARTLAEAQRLGLRTRAYVAVAFDCPFEGETPLAEVVRLAARMHEEGAGEIVIADTIGSASPGQVKERISALREVVPVGQLAVHFHDTRGMGVANVIAAVRAGAVTVDAAIGGTGGCPFAPGAAGNVASEDVAYALGEALDLDIAKLVDAAGWLNARLGREQTSAVARAFASA
jgi:hydroxymethylglutaryl-CoA lyase